MLTVTEQPTTILVYTRNNEEQLKVFIVHAVFVIITISNYSGKRTRNLPLFRVYFTVSMKVCSCILISMGRSKIICTISDLFSYRA